MSLMTLLSTPLFLLFIEAGTDFFQESLCLCNPSILLFATFCMIILAFLEEKIMIVLSKCWRGLSLTWEVIRFDAI